MQNLYFKFPSTIDAMAASKAYKRAYTHFVSMGLLTKEELPFYFKKHGLFSAEEEERITQLESSEPVMYPKLPEFKNKNAEAAFIESCMIEIILGRRVVPISSLFEQSEKDVTPTEVELVGLKNIKSQYTKVTADHLAEQVKMNYLTYCCVYKNETERLWSSYDEYLKEKREVFIRGIQHKLVDFLGGLSSTVLRKIARHALWRTRWIGATKTGAPLFEGTISEWDMNKLLLTYWSNFYDSIYAAYKAPGKFVIEDDKLLDAWLEQQARDNDNSAETDASSEGIRGIFKTTVAPLKKRGK